MAETIEVTHVPESDYLHSLESRSDLKVLDDRGHCEETKTQWPVGNWVEVELAPFSGSGSTKGIG